MQEPLWFPKLMHRWSKQLWEPWASHACAGALRKMGCVPCQGDLHTSHGSPGSEKEENGGVHRNKGGDALEISPEL